MKKYLTWTSFFQLGAYMLVGALWATGMTLLEKNDNLQRLLDQQGTECPAQVCPNVQVTCVCPEYDEGWDDAQFAEGCAPTVTELPIDDLHLICAELDEYGYIPGC